MRRTGLERMLYRDFRHVIELLQQCAHTQRECSKYINPQVFDDHTELITTLMKQVYNEASVTIILDKWLCGDHSPVVFTDNKGITVETPIESVKELWKAMETYGSHKNVQRPEE